MERTERNIVNIFKSQRSLDMQFRFFISGSGDEESGNLNKLPKVT